MGLLVWSMDDWAGHLQLICDLSFACLLWMSTRKCQGRCIVKWKCTLEFQSYSTEWTFSVQLRSLMRSVCNKFLVLTLSSLRNSCRYIRSPYFASFILFFYLLPRLSLKGHDLESSKFLAIILSDILIRAFQLCNDNDLTTLNTVAFDFLVSPYSRL